jgi:hypothetical protein
MESPQSVLELVAAAQVNAAASEGRVSEVLKLMNGQGGSDAQVEELRAATVALEMVAVDIFSVFEARMQHHFKRGPFSRKLKSLLLTSRKADLANRVYQHYLAINVLKHGKGASYRELLDNRRCLFVLKSAEEVATDGTTTPVGLVDVTTPGFFDGLATTIIEAYHFLEDGSVA